MRHNPQDILDFCFSAENEGKLFSKDVDFDEEIRRRFTETWQTGCEGLLYFWRDTLTGRVAEIIVLDQFSRNLMRNNPRSYTQDGMALVLAQAAVQTDGFADLPENYRHLALMPFMHSESRGIHEIAVPLFEKYAPAALDYEIRHKKIIDRFGYYPHRKQALGMVLNAEEKEFLQDENNRF